MAGPWVALESTTDRRALARRLARSRDRVLAGGRPRGLRDVIVGSWRRSRAAGVDAEAALAPVAIDPEEAGERWRAHPLSGAMDPVRDLLTDVAADAAQAMLFCDRDGTLLWIDGDPHVLDEAREVHLQPGAVWSESAAGTNAMGTALSVDHALQVFSAEHFARAVGGWTCSAAPVRDPDTGEPVGVVDLSGALATAHPHSLAVVATAARLAEDELRRRADAVAARLVDAHGRRVGRGRGLAHALAGPSGVVLVAAPDSLAGRRLAIPAGGGQVALPGGGAVVAEALPGGGGYLLWHAGRAAAAEEAATLRLEGLGRERAELRLGGEATTLSPRHGELLALLALRPEGWTAEQLAIELLGDFGKPVTVRAELSRLRRLLGDRLTAQPYRIAGPLSVDFVEVQALADAGRVPEALDRYAGELLPPSEVPPIVEARRRLDLGLRAAVLAAADADLLERWLATSSGRDDEAACRALLALVSPADRRYAVALGRLERLSRAGARP